MKAVSIPEAKDRIDYTGPFKENVQGHLLARFRLDAVGKPIWEPSPDDRRLRVYVIDVFLATPQASQIKGVRYFMDDPSFEDDPQAYSEDRDNEFREAITSYGEVEVVVTVEMSKHAYVQRAWLSNMLENGHANDMTSVVRAAIQRIKAN